MRQMRPQRPFDGVGHRMARPYREVFVHHDDHFRLQAMPHPTGLNALDTLNPVDMARGVLDFVNDSGGW